MSIINQDEFNRLVEILKSVYEIRHELTQAGLENLAQYLLSHGVVVPPCKAGDKIYTIIEDGEDSDFVDEGTVVSISYQDHCWIHARYECGLTYAHKCDSRDYFFSKEEAESALKGE